MVDLKCNYLDLELKNPLVASASPLSKKISLAKQLEDAGVSAIVMYSLFQEQIQHASKELDFFLSRGTDQFAEALTYFPDLGTYNVGVDAYLEEVRTLKECLSIPIIGSLNGLSTGDWVKNAALIEQAGADALELNYYFIPTDPTMTSQSIEKDITDMVSGVCHKVHIPVSVKLSPFFTALPNLAQRIVKAGADGLVLFNRFMQPDLDIEALEVDAFRRLSTSDEMLLPLRWVALLYGRIKADLALTTGVHCGVDIVKAVMAGANVVMVASEFLANGSDRANVMLGEITQWMETFEYENIKQMLGSLSQEKIAMPAVYERAQYMKALQAFDHHLP
jgi:dihydroorotate dehydrogenase (fumarate)